MPTSWPLNEPFYEGAITTELGGVHGLVGLYGHPYLIDVRQYRRRFVDALRAAQDTSSQPGEQTLNPEGVWTRFGTDWRFGAGQPRYDGQEANRSRFYASVGIDPWTQGEISLQHDTQSLWADADPVLRLIVGPSDQLVIVQADAVTVLVAGAPSSVTGLGGRTIYDASGDSTRVWLATDDGVWSFTYAGLAAATFTPADHHQWDSIIIANGRLVGGYANTLAEIDGTGVVSTIRDHTSASFRWTLLAEHPAWIYAGGSIGNRFELFRVGIAADGSFDAPVQAMPLLGGEAVNAFVYYQGKVVLGTTRGFRFCDVDTNGSIAFGAVVEQPGSVADLYAAGDFVYFTWDQVAVGLAGIGRIVPARFGFAEGNVPAWASDLTYADLGPVTAVAEHQGNRVFAVGGVGVVRENTDYVETGYLDTGTMDFDIPYTVQPLSVLLRTRALAAGESVIVEYTVAEASPAVLGNHVDLGAKESPKYIFPPMRTDGVNLTLTLNGDGSSTPTLTTWIFQVAPQPQRIETIELPIVVSPEFAPDENAERYYLEPLVEYRRLKGLVESGILVVYQEGDHAYNVKLTNLELQPNKWTDTPKPYDFFQGILMVTMQVVDNA